MHKAKACVISCMDFRFQKKIQDFLLQHDYLGNCDEITVAGCSRDFIKPVHPADQEYVWMELGLSVKLHDPEEIMFIDHQDCGGYAQDKTIPAGLSKEEDKQDHAVFLTKLREKLSEKYPGKKLSFWYAPLEGDLERFEF